MIRKFNKAEEVILENHYVKDGWRFCQQKILAELGRAWGQNNLYTKAVGMGLIQRATEGLAFTMPKAETKWPKLPRTKRCA